MSKFNNERFDFKKQEPNVSGYFPKFVEHPAFHQWFFTPETANKITTEVMKKLKPGDSVSCLGTPYLALYLKERLSNDVNVTILDKDEYLLNKVAGQYSDSEIKRKLYDINNNLKESETNVADCVIIDPPWYEDYYKLFIMRSSEILKKNGHLVMVLLPPDTRETAPDERTKFIEFTRNQGFEVRELLLNFIDYQTPNHEQQFFGHPDKPWRKADLVILEKVTDTKLPSETSPVIEKKYEEFDFQYLRIVIPVTKQPIERVTNIQLKGQQQSRGGKIERVSDNVIWMSDGNIYETNNPKVCAHILKLISTAITTTKGITDEIFTHEEFKNLDKESLGSTIEKLKKITYGLT